jgi:hypothetical protein
MLQEIVKERGVFKIERFDVDIMELVRHIALNYGNLADQQAVAMAQSFHEVPAWIQLRADAMMREYCQPEVSEFENGLLNAGITAFLNIFYGNTSGANSSGSAAGANAVPNNAQARLGVGDSTTGFNASQTDLQASSNKYYQGMDATYPSVSNQTISFKATITGSNANFAWNEFVTDACNGSNATSTSRNGGGATFNRAVSSQGTKGSGSTWALTLTITFS